MTGAAGLIMAGFAAAGAALAQTPPQGDNGFLPTAPPKGPIIESETLAPLDPWSVSGLGRGEGAKFSRNLWRASTADGIAALADETPTALASPTAWALLRDAMAAPGDPPRANAGVDSRMSARKRVEALARLGAADETAALAIGPLREEPSVVIFAAQADLARNRVGPACTRLQQLAPTETSAFAVRMRAVCLSVDGQSDAALLAMEIAAATSAGDPWLSAALRTMAGMAPSGPRAQPTTARYETSLNAAVSLLANLAPPRDVDLRTASLFALRALESAETTPPAVRADAAMRLLRLGRINPTAAREAIAALATPNARTLAPWPKLVRDLETAETNAAKALVLQRAIDAGPAAAQPGLVHQLFDDELRALSADPSVLIGAASFARASLAAGDLPTARAWRAKADRTRSDPRAIATLDAAFAIAGQASPTDLRFIAERRAEAGGPNALRDVRALFAMGAPIQGAAADLLSAQPTPVPSRQPPSAQAQKAEARLGQLAEAKRRGATGEVALLAGLLSAEGAGRLEPAALEEVVSALKQVGLTPYASALAIEALMSAAPPAAPRR